jgi:hypothetical protein
VAANGFAQMASATMTFPGATAAAAAAIVTNLLFNLN